VAGHVFVSYSHADDDYVRRLVARLQAEGFDVWSDEGIDVGSQWISVVRGKVDDCSAFVLVMTPQAETSTWVARELERAEAKGKPILPLLLDGRLFASLPMIQYENVSDGIMPSERFLNRLRTLAHGTSSPAQPAPRVQPVSAPLVSARAAAPPAVPVLQPPPPAPFRPQPAVPPVTSVQGPGRIDAMPTLSGRRWLAWTLLALAVVQLAVGQFSYDFQGDLLAVLAARVDVAAQVVAAIVVLVGALRRGTWPYAARAMITVVAVTWLAYFWYKWWYASTPSFWAELVPYILPMGCLVGVLVSLLRHRHLVSILPAYRLRPLSTGTYVVTALGGLAIATVVVPMASAEGAYLWVYPLLVAVFGAVVIEAGFEPMRSVRRQAAVGVLAFAILQMIGIASYEGFPFFTTSIYGFELVLQATLVGLLAVAVAAAVLLTLPTPSDADQPSARFVV
jgi:hypothetical protein